MLRRIYWLCPDLPSARQTLRDLLSAHVPERRIHVVSPRGSDPQGLHPANLLQTSDIVRAVEVGALLGGVCGALVGAALPAYLPIDEDLDRATLMLTLTPLGAVLGAWASSLVGISVPSVRIERFRQAVEQGQVLMLVDVPRARVDELTSLLSNAHPEGRLEGLEPAVPVLP